MSLERDSTLFSALVEMADAAAAGYDVVELADSLVSTCVRLLGVDNAGFMLDDQRGSLEILASTSEETHLLELLELSDNQGPCLAAFRTGAMVSLVDLTPRTKLWPAFTAEALRQGIRTTYAMPISLRGRVIGALNLFKTSPGPLDAATLQVAYVLANMAAIGIINHWTLQQQELLNEQLQTALQSRIIVEQAKGIIAAQSNVEIQDAFGMLRAAARSARRPVSELAHEIVERRQTDVLKTSGPLGARAGPQQASQQSAGPDTNRRSPEPAPPTTGRG